MPHQSLKLIPGVDVNRTVALNEAAISDCNLIRFMVDRQGLGLPQKLGGWTRFYRAAISTSVRALHAWADTNDISWLAIGAEGELDVLRQTDVGTDINPISPQYYTANPPPNIATLSGSASVFITDDGSNVSSYDSVWIKTHIAVDGVVLYGYYQCAASSSNQYSVVSSNVIGNPVLATGTTPSDLFTGMAVTAASEAAGVATVSFTGDFLAPVGCYVMISGVTPADYNGLHMVSSSTPGATSTVSFSIATAPGAGTGGDVTYVPIAVLSTTASAVSVSVALAGHGYAPQSTYPLLADVTVGGITLPSGNYLVQSVPNANTFTITAQNAAVTADTVIINGGNAEIEYFIGQVAVPLSTGYGSGGYGYGGYGSGVSFGGGRTIPVISAYCVGTSATLTFALPILITVGSTIAVTGVTPSDYNSPTGTFWTVTSSTENSVTFTVPATISAGSGGGITVNNFAFEGGVDWSLDNYGGYLVSSPRDGGIFFWSPESGSGRSTVVPNAPLLSRGFFVAMPERQVVAYGSSSNGVQDPLLVKWSDVANFTVWVGNVVNQAGQYRIPKGSKIVGAIQGPQQGLIWTDLAVWSMQYINMPYIYSFNQIADGCGLIGQKAVGTLSGSVYWMSQSQFFMLDGSGVNPVMCPIWDVIFQDIDMSQSDHIRCAPNSRFNEISWYYPVMNADGSAGDGVPKKYVKFNTVLRQWDFGTLSRTAWIDQSVFGPPIGSSSQGVIMQHEVGNDRDGHPMSSFVTTGYFALGDGDLMTFVDQVWPDMKWGFYGSSDQGAAVKITFYVTDYPGDTPRVFGPYTTRKEVDYISPRFRGRLVSIKVSSNDLGSFWRLGNIRYRYQPDGKF